MAAIRPRRQLALDTNVVLDLAGRTDFAHDFKETFQAKGYILRLPPTAALELHELYQDGETEEKRELARIALLSVRRWNVQPLDLAEIEQTIATRFAQRLAQSALLPVEEFHDALILAETGVAEIPLLVTSDKHLLEIDEDALLLLFNEADLSPVRPVHPRRLLRAVS